MEIAEPEVKQQSRYRIEHTLGAGGMGIVYLAQDSKLQRPVAIKKLRDDSTSQSARARIQSEAQLLAKLNHPNIVQLYDVLEEHGGIALVMEYVEGTSLREWMREHTTPLRQKLELLMQICRGLQEAHTLGIIHRDLKPDNILITQNASGGYTAKITDFGIAKSQDQQNLDLTQDNHVAGTVSAMSPEQIQGRPLDARSDLFSFGTIAYELLCRAKPFANCEGGSLALANHIVNEMHIPASQAWAKIPEPLSALLDRLLSKKPAQRPESAQQVYEALGFLQQLSSDTETLEFSRTATQLLRKPPSKYKRIIGALIGIAALTNAGYWSWKYFTYLEPKYIAVLPVEINGEIRGEENAKELTAAMVRQALTSSAMQLKNTALVSFTPKVGDDLDAHLQTLYNKGVTDALGARLLCAQTRCEIELQRLSPADGQIKQQTSFAFLADKRQEAEYQIGNSAAALFPINYLDAPNEQIKMSGSDYDDYLDILGRLEQKDIQESDQQKLEQLINSYPRNTNLYAAHTSVSAKLFVQTNIDSYLARGLAMLERAKLHDIDSRQLLGQELWLRTYSTEKSQFDALLKKFDEQTTPTADLIAKYARFLYAQGDYEAGLRYAREAADLSPSADNLYLVALNQTAGGDYAEARKTLSRTVNLFPSHWSSFSALGVIELESGNLEAAETAITAIPSSLRGWRTASNLGVVYFLQQKYPEALQIFQQVLTRVPGNAPTTGQIAETYLMLGDSENARATFNELLQLTEDKEDLASRRYQALAKAYLGQASSAISIILALLREAPEDTDIKYSAAQVYTLAEEWRSANYYLEELLQQGMSADWFRLPVFRQLCNRESTTAAVAAVVCQ